MIYELREKKEELQEQIEELNEKIANIESDMEESFRESINCEGVISICDITFEPARILEEIDPLAYSLGLSNFCDEKLSELESELDELNSELDDIEHQIAEMKEGE
jgi:outer membrane murein-binding lipoprotein Lpp